MDLNHGPSGYEPDELPDCSTPRRCLATITKKCRRLQTYNSVNFTPSILAISHTMQNAFLHTSQIKFRHSLSYRNFGIIWWRSMDLNHGPSGYEPDELPDCSTPRRCLATITKKYRRLQIYFRDLCGTSPNEPEGYTVINSKCITRCLLATGFYADFNC